MTLWYLVRSTTRARFGKVIEAPSLASAFAKALDRFEEAGVEPLRSHYQQERKSYEDHTSDTIDCEIEISAGVVYYLKDVSSV